MLKFCFFGFLVHFFFCNTWTNDKICLKLKTAFFFLAVYYGAPVWMISSLKCKEWTLFESSRYKAMRIALREHTISLPGATIDNQWQHATPRQWSAYINASTVIKILNTKEPKILVKRVRLFIYKSEKIT